MARAWIVQESHARDHKTINSVEINWEKVKSWLADRNYDIAKIWSDAQTNRGVARDTCLKIWLKEYANIETKQLKPSDLMQSALKLARDKKLSAPRKKTPNGTLKKNVAIFKNSRELHSRHCGKNDV